MTYVNHIKQVEEEYEKSTREIKIEQPLLYSVMYLRKNATDKNIKNNYKQLAMNVCHPDKIQGEKPELMPLATTTMKILNMTKDVLRDDSKRKEYDNLPPEQAERIISGIEDNIKALPAATA